MSRSILRELIRCGHSAPSADNTQPWKFTWDGKNLCILYDEARVAGNTFVADNPATLLSIGAVIENIKLAADFYNLAVQTTLNPDPGQDQPFAVTHIADATGAFMQREDNPVLNRHTNRFAYTDKAIPPEIMTALPQQAEEPVTADLFSQTNELVGIANLVKHASELRFQIREAHEMLGQSLRFSRGSIPHQDGIEVRSLDLPPGGAYFMRFTRSWRRMAALNKLGANKLMASVDSAPIRSGPLLLAISGPASAVGAIMAGQVMCRCWTYLNLQGLAVHPYYVISDQMTRIHEHTMPEQLKESALQLQQKSADFFRQGGDNTLYMLLRIGYPSRQAPRSGRLPLDSVYADLSV